MKLSKLLEAGRRNSSSDLKLLQTMHDHAVSLGASCGASESARVDDPDIHISDAFREALDLSYSDISSLLRTELKVSYPGDRVWVWIRDVYDDRVVYSVEGDSGGETIYQRSYSIVDGKVTFGDAVAVMVVTTYVPVAESDTPADTPNATESEEITTDLVPLVEKAVRKDGTATIKIIAPGQGSSGFYPADVLKRDGPTVFVEGTHVYLDHPSVTEASDRPERSVKDLAGSLTGAATWQDDGAAGPGLYAPVKFIDSVAPHINDIAAISGMSIRAGGTMGTREVEGKKVRTIESIDVAHSVDVVTKPGAGGKVLDLIESARSGNPPQRQTAPPQPGGSSVELQEQLTEAIQERDDARGKLTEAQQLIDKQTVELARLREQNVLRDANAVIAETLADMDLHQMTRERLTKHLIANPPIKDGELDREVFVARVTEAAKAEQTYLAVSTGGTGQVRGMGVGGGDFDASAAMIAAFKEAGYSDDVARQMAAQ